MSAEWVTAIATAGTFVVIAASAIAALMQLRHMRSGNQIAALTELRETMESATFQKQMREVAGTFKERLKDHEFRKPILTERHLYTFEGMQAPITVANFFENAGALVKHHIIDAEIFCDLWSPTVVNAWNALEEFVANRRAVTHPGTYENFEYLAVLGERYMAKHEHGTIPARQMRKQRAELWPETMEFIES
jgi:hypothetical protein